MAASPVPAVQNAPSPRTVLETLRYHDLQPLIGVTGVGMTWSVAKGMGHAAAVTNEAINNRTGFSGTLVGPELRDPALALRAVVFERCGKDAGRGSWLAWRTLFPGPHDGVADAWGEKVASSGDAAAIDELGRLHRQRAREALASLDLPRPMRDAFLHLMGNGPFDLPGIHAILNRASNRRESLPWAMVPFVADNPGVMEWLVNEPEFRAVLDGVAPREILRRLHPGLTDAKLLRLRGKTATMLGGGQTRPLSVPDATGGTLAAVASVPLEWFPAGGDWEAFIRVGLVASTVASFNDVDLATLLAPSKGDWSACLARIEGFVRLRPGQAPPADDRIRSHNIHLVGLDTAGPVHGAIHDFLGPLLAHAGRVSEADLAFRDVRLVLNASASRMLYGGKSLAAVLELSRTWHLRQGAIATVTREAEPLAAWQALIPETDLGQGIHAVTVHDAISLAEEGMTGPDRTGMAGLEHCVATRLYRYREGTGHLLSIRRVDHDGGRTRLASAEVAVDYARKVAVVELRGPRNTAAPPEAVAALKDLLRKVERGDIALNPEAIRLRAPGNAALRDRCGYDWRDPDAVMTAAAAWSPMLPRWFRGLDIPGMVAALDARGFLDRLAPVDGAVAQA